MAVTAGISPIVLAVATFEGAKFADKSIKAAGRSMAKTVREKLGKGSASR